VRLEDDGETLSFTAPYGLDDIFALVVKPNTAANLPADVYPSRIAAKQWHTLWPKLQIQYA
jgi:hypothetical protein